VPFPKIASERLGDIGQGKKLFREEKLRWEIKKREIILDKKRMQILLNYHERPITKERSLPEVFNKLANRWHNEIDYLSSPSRIISNDAYLEIISMGKSVIPFILQDLQERGGDWYPALRILSGTDPVPVNARGDVPRMKESWLRWGRDIGYIK
jgi:hypothetical protein